MKRLVSGLFAVGALVFAACGKTKDQPDAHAGMPGMETPPAPATESAVPDRAPLAAQQAKGLGITYTTVRRGPLVRAIRTVGQVQPPETHLADITPKVDGFVERLLVNFTGQEVRRGQPLLSLYSPMLVSAQNELLSAKRLVSQVDSGAGEAWVQAQDLLEAARRRLAYWDITPAQIAEIERSGTVTKTLTLVAPVDGVVLEKMVVQGQQVMPGMKLYRLAGLSSVWVEGEVFEQDLHYVEVGCSVRIEVATHPGEEWRGAVSFVYPTVTEASRTNRVRVTVRNAGLRLKPGMYATMYFDAHVSDSLPVIPLAAVVMTGERNIVFVRDSGDRLTPREVTLGNTGGDHVEVVRGLREGETIVASANFLLDAESRLAAGTGAAMSGMDMGTPTGAKQRGDTGGQVHD